MVYWTHVIIHCKAWNSVCLSKRTELNICGWVMLAPDLFNKNTGGHYVLHFIGKCWQRVFIGPLRWSRRFSCLSNALTIWPLQLHYCRYFLFLLPVADWFQALQHRYMQQTKRAIVYSRLHDVTELSVCSIFGHAIKRAIQRGLTWRLFSSKC